jgi:hypothetical protein
MCPQQNPVQSAKDTLNASSEGAMERELSLTKARADGLLLLFLGGLIFVVFGCVLEASSPATMGDFRMQYYPARCLVLHGDPYSQSDVMRAYRADGGGRPDEGVGSILMTTEYIYPPTSFIFTAPLAILPYGPAHLIWMAATFASLILAGVAMWDLGSAFAPVLSGALIGFLLANSELIVTTGNVAGIALGLAGIAVWCILKERFVAVGVCCLAASIALKPHDTWLVWLFFLLAGGMYRKRALQTLAAGAALGLPAIAWVTYVSPHWIHELETNLLLMAERGGTDPGRSGYGPSLIIDLQAAISYFRNDPRLYNSLSYCVCGALLLVWCVNTVRTKLSIHTVWLALATVAALSMLPVYHREIDAKLLLLTVPGCAMLWSEGERVGRLAAAITVAGLFVTADIPWAINIWVFMHLGPEAGFSRQLLSASQVLAVPLQLLTESIFFLWIYVRRSRAEGLRMEIAAPAAI